MTLIIAGHKLEKGFTWGGVDSELEESGLFIASDSAITDSNNKTLLGGFKKVYSVPVRVWKPYFIENTFHSYQSIFYQSECFIAIAGSTLTAQHVVNLISEHLANLQITYFPPSAENKQAYRVVRHCSENPLKIHPGIDSWSENMFTDNDYYGIVTGEVFDEVIEHSINTALLSARKYKLDEDSLRQMYTEFAAGIYCPNLRKHRLFTYRTKHEKNQEGVYEVFAEKEEVLPNEVAVLGMAKRFKDGAQRKFEEAISSRTPPASVMFDYLNSAIDEVCKEGGAEIDRPSVLRYFEEGKIERVNFQS